MFKDDGVRNHNQIQGIDEEGNLKNIKVNENGELLIKNAGGNGEDKEVSIKGLTITEDGKVLVSIQDTVEVGIKGVTITEDGLIPVKTPETQEVTVKGVSITDGQIPVFATIKKESVKKTLMCDVISVTQEGVSVEVNANVTKLEIANYSETNKVNVKVGEKTYGIGANMALNIVINGAVLTLEFSTDSEEAINVQYLVEAEEGSTNPKIATVSTPDGENIALGTTTVNDLQENIIVKSNKVTGTSKYQENFSDFGGSDNSGNFLVLKINEATEGKVVTTKIIGTGASGKTVTLTDDGIIIYQVHDNDNKLVIMCEGKEARILDLTDLVLLKAE